MGYEYFPHKTHLRKTAVSKRHKKNPFFDQGWKEENMSQNVDFSSMTSSGQSKWKEATTQ